MNCFNLPSKCDNWKMVFGNKTWTWFLPICPMDMRIDPHNFPKRIQIEVKDYEMIAHSSLDKESQPSIDKNSNNI